MRPKNPQRLEPEFAVWTNIKRKGLPMSLEWRGVKGYEAFLKDVGRKPSEFAVLKRIDKTQGWFPGNTIWYNVNMVKLDKLDPNMPVKDRIAKLKEYGVKAGYLKDQEEKEEEPIVIDIFGQD